MTIVRISLLFAILLISVPLSSQEPTAPPEYILLSESSILQSDSADWAEAMTLTARAHAKHTDGNAWVTYRKLTGGPEETVRTFFPLARLGDLDDWKSNHQILVETLGQDRARIVRTDLDLATDSAERVLSFSSKMSRPWPDLEPPMYTWVEEVRVEEGKMVEYAALAQRVVRAFANQDGEGYWIVYGNAIGGDSSELLWIYGFDRFAEIDAWNTRLETMSKATTEGEAARLVAAMEAISESTSSLWQLESVLSQIEGR